MDNGTVVAEALAAGDFLPHDAIAAFAWPLLIHAGGLAEQAGNRLQLTARGRAALSRPAADTVRQLWRRWVSHGLIDEMSRIDAIKGQRCANVLTALKPRRQTVAAALVNCPSGEWITVEELFAAMRRDDLSPTVARSEQGLWKLYIVDPQYGSLGYAGFRTGPSWKAATRCACFLSNRSHTELPSTVTTLIDDVTGRASRLRDLGVAQLVECADPALAILIANDRRLRTLCHPVGDRHLAVPPEHGTAFRKGLRTLGYALH